jgi:D-proline reductase (dithiol) PrdB
VIERAGITTICLNMMPDYSRAYGFPRVAALEVPFGMTVGQPGDRNGQLRVLRAALQALSEITEPGQIVHLPFEWSEEPGAADWHPAEPSPVAKAMMEGKIADPVATLGQARWPDLDLILGNAHTKEVSHEISG